MVTVDRKRFELLKKKLLDEKKLEILIVSDSMEPVIKTGQTIEVEAIKEPLKLGDIIVFWSDGRLICHWVFRAKSSFNNGATICSSLKSPRLDFPVDKENILGIAKTLRINHFRLICHAVKRVFL